MLSEVSAFNSYNLLIIHGKNKLTKSLTITIDYIYFSSAFVALLLKYLSMHSSHHADFDTFAFIFGAVAIALRVTKANIEYIMYRLEKG